MTIGMIPYLMGICIWNNVPADPLMQDIYYLDDYPDLDSVDLGSMYSVIQ